MTQYTVSYGSSHNNACRRSNAPPRNRQINIEDVRGWEHIGIPMKFLIEPGQHTEANLRKVGYSDASNIKERLF